MEFRQGNLSKARELFQRGIWADPDSPSVALVFQAWAVLERAAGDYESARALFKCAVRADPKNSPSWMVSGGGVGGWCGVVGVGCGVWGVIFGVLGVIFGVVWRDGCRGEDVYHAFLSLTTHSQFDHPC